MRVETHSHEDSRGQLSNIKVFGATHLNGEFPMFACLRRVVMFQPGLKKCSWELTRSQLGAIEIQAVAPQFSKLIYDDLRPGSSWFVADVHASL